MKYINNSIKTTFINNTNIPHLKSPFQYLPNSKTLPNYLKKLSTELLHYHPSITSTLTLTITNNQLHIITTFTK